MYNWRGKNGPLQWRIGNTLYLSCVFTWDIPLTGEIASKWKRGPVYVGGPAIKLAGLDVSDLPYAILPFHNPLATFTSRGCPNACHFCAVPKTEGDFIELQRFTPAPVVCDNNFLASSRKHFNQVIDALKIFPRVDFNQGLDASLFTKSRARKVAELQGVKVRFSYDGPTDESPVMDAIRTARACGLTDIGVYVLIGFNDTPRGAQHRLEQIRTLGLRPNPMRYQPIEGPFSLVKDSYVGPGWTKDGLRNMMRYYSRLRYLEHVPFEDYKYGQGEQDCLI